MSLLVSLKDLVTQKTGVRELGDAFRQIENWAKNTPEMPTLTGGKIQSGSFTANFAGVSGVSGSLNFPKPFVTTPQVLLTVLVGSNFDVNANLQGVSTGGFSWRLFQNLGGNLTTTATCYWLAIGT